MNAERLTGRTVLITGAAQGQGAAHARRLADEGASVVLGDIDEAGAAAVAASIAAEGKRAIATGIDVAAQSDWERFISSALDHFGSIHGLVNNAGISSTPSLDEWDATSWERVIEINQTSVALGMSLIVPPLRDSGGGSIVNVSSVWAHSGGEGSSFGYVATKAAVLGMTKAAALEVAADGIRINSISPGYLQHQMGGSLEKPAAGGIPMGRAGSVDEMSGTIAFLLSDDSSYITGVDLLIDGGQHLG